jgi:hypothetical protein
LVELYKLYDQYRDPILWFLEEPDVNSYEGYLKNIQALLLEDLTLVQYAAFLNYQEFSQAIA